MRMGAVGFASQQRSRQPSSTAGTGASVRLSKFSGGRATACLVALWSSTARGAGVENTMAYVSRSRAAPGRAPAAAFAARLSFLRKNSFSGGGRAGAGRGTSVLGEGMRTCCSSSSSFGAESERNRKSGSMHSSSGAACIGGLRTSGWRRSNGQSGATASRGYARLGGGITSPLNIMASNGSRRSLASAGSPGSRDSTTASKSSKGDGYAYGGNDPDNEDIPSGPVGEGWVSGRLSDDVAGGVVFDDNGVEDEDGKGDEEAVDMAGLKGGRDEGGGWVTFQLKDGESIEVDDDELDGGEDEEDDMDARIRDAMAPRPKLAVKRMLDTDAEDFGFARDQLNLEKLQISVPDGCCPGCGSQYQSGDAESPGFLPAEKLLAMEAKKLGIPVEQLLAFEEDKRAREKSSGDGTLPDINGSINSKDAMDAEAWLDAQPDIKNSLEFELENDQEERAMFPSSATRKKPAADRDVGLGRAARDSVAAPSKAAEAARDEDDDEPVEKEEEEKLVVCQRCHKLRFYGSVSESLRPGFSDSDLLTPKRFLELLGTLRTRKCLVIYLVDLFDFHGSFLFNLPKIVGDNPVLVAGNKADLLPKDLSKERVTKWVRDKCRESGLPDMEMRDIHLVSCKMGYGLAPLMRKAREEALYRRCDIYVIGAANVGKSTFINHIIQDKGDNGGGIGSRRSGGRGSQKPGKGGGKGGRGKPGRGVTVSSVPGTTLGFLKVDLGEKRSLFDTPGLLLLHTLTSRLNGDELRAVIPKKRVEHVTLRLGEGKSVLIGGFARLEVVEGRPFLLTFFVSNEVRLHPTGTQRVQDMLSKHVGKDQLIFPPFEPERIGELGEQVATDFDIIGAGWRESAADVVIAGLSWISVTGAGPITLRVWAPKGVLVMAREPLLPYESWETTSKFTGSATVKKGKKKQGRRV